MIKVEYVNAMGRTIIESLDYALSYASMAWDARGFRTEIFNLDGSKVEYDFDARGNAVLNK